MKKTILIIDDDKNFQKAIIPKLESLSYSVVSAFDGEDGYNKAITINPDLILLDIRMPKMDGITLLKKINTNKDLHIAPILLTSNLTDVDYVSQGVVLGARGYIIKSAESLDNILREIENIINNG